MSREFQAKWLTIPSFAHVQPRNLYHKESARFGDGCRSAQSDDQRNLHVLARSVLVIDEEELRSARWLLRFTADDYGKLYINGQYVGQGPAPAYPEYYYYQEIDVTEYLQPGDNVLALHLYYQGLVNRVWNSGDGRFGMACELLAEGIPQRREELTWNYRISQAFSGNVTGYDTQYLENFDSRQWEENWSSVGYDDRDWKPMVPMVYANYHCQLQPTEMLSVYPRKPRKILRTNRGWLIDMGEEVTGALRLVIDAPMDCSQVVIRFGEEVEEDGSVRHQMRCNCDYEECWTLHKGVCRFEGYDYKGFRYAELICDEQLHFQNIEAVIRHYPLREELCCLHTDDPQLDRIFLICKNGIKYGTQEGYLDCPTREKGQYLGDAVIAARAQVWLTGDVRMLRKCIRQFAQTAMICPGLMGVAPGAYMQEIADFSLLWPELLMTDYAFTADRVFLREHLPVVRGILEYFRQYERADGLLDQVADKWNLVDWPENLRDGYDFGLTRPVVARGCHNVINALYIGAVQTYEAMEWILRGERDSADEPEGLPMSSEQLKQAFIEAFFSEDTGLFTDSEESDHSSVHANIYPLYFGFCSDQAEEGVADYLSQRGLCCGVMTGYFLLRALARAGCYQDVYNIMTNDSLHGWVNMLREGATTCWEAWGKDQKWNTSLCHPWGSGPISIIIEEIAGFRLDPESPSGFQFEEHIPKHLVDFDLIVPFRGKKYHIYRELSGRTTLTVH